MKRRNLIHHIELHGCEFLREGANHTVYVNNKYYFTLTALDIEALEKNKDLIEISYEDILTTKGLYGRPEKRPGANAEHVSALNNALPYKPGLVATRSRVGCCVSSLK